MLCCALTFLSPCIALAAMSFDTDSTPGTTAFEPVAPHTAYVSPTGARLDVRQKARVRLVNGKSQVDFVLPPDSANLQLTVPGQTISRWSSTPALFDPTSAMAGRRARVEASRVELTAQLMTVNSRIALWQAPPKSASAHDVELLQSAMAQEMPKLVLEQAALERKLKLVNEELARMPEASGIGERIRVVLNQDLPEGQEVEVLYSYQHDSCGWDAIYDFNAKPDEGTGDIIDVRLLAEVWQFTGMDWKDTKIILATKGHGPREPYPLPEWIIDSQARHQPRVLSATRAKANAVTMAEDAAPPMAAVSINTDAVFAEWTLAETGLPQGRSRLQITSAAWKAPLQWLSRPSRDNGQVWLVANYQLPADQAWPDGQAQYNVDGQSVGNGIFRPRSGEATLYFGADPRVTVVTDSDSRKRGSAGIIATTNTFTWSWKYTISNQHSRPIKVKVERPAPVVVDENIRVSYNDNPAAVLDTKEHMLVWEIPVPANGKGIIDHAVTLSSPGKLPLLPDIP